MKHTIIYKNKNRYSSFPLLTKLEDRILIGYFTAPVPDHMGLFEWEEFISSDNGDTWSQNYIPCPYDWPSVSPREISDRFAYELNGRQFVIGSYGFRIKGYHKTGKKGIQTKINKGNSLFIRSSDDNWKTINQRFYETPTADIVLTFPRPLIPRGPLDPIMLIPAYAVLKNGLNRALAWHSSDYGKSWQLYNMFPDEVNANEMAFIWTNNGILAHIRSDNLPYIMESWSEDGKTWTYPTCIYSCTFGIKTPGNNVIGGPPHLLKLNDSRILCSYGYRQNKMGIQAIVSEDEGYTWGKPIVLRDDGGYRSSLHKRKWRNRFKLSHPTNDIGYPVSIQLDNDEILTAYYITCTDQITGIETTKWKV